MEKKKTKTGLFGKKSSSGRFNSKKSKLNNFYDNTQDFLVVDGVLKKYNGSETVVTIPSDMDIDSIGQRAFYKRTDVRTIIIPNGIRSIANYAFSCCENLSSVTIPDTVNFIGNYAFENCTSLTKIDLPGRLQSVGSYLFSGCTRLVDVTLPYELKSIGNYMFYKCTSLASVNLPNKIQNIGWKAFSGCTSLTEIKLPKTCDTLGNNAFENCYKLNSIHLSDNITNLGEGVFFMCKGLSSITIDDTNANYKVVDGALFSYDEKILYTYPSKLNTNTAYTVPDTVTSICYGAFSSCINLHTITLPDSIEFIDNCAFFNCLNLSNINLPNNLRTIGKNVFNNCYNLKEITLPNSIDTIETGLFSGCSGLEKVYMSEDVKFIGEIAFFGCIKLKDFEFPKNLQSIGCAAFTNCQSITRVNIHKNISSIARGAFSHCRLLTTINVSEDNNNYSSNDGVLYTKDGTCLLVYPAGKLDKSFTIPSNVTTINDQAFYGAIMIEEVTLPSSITDIGLSAFSECPKISKVVIEEGLENIGTFVFSKNPRLSIVSLPKSVTSIDPSAFSECENLTFVCSTDSFAYKFASIKNIPLYSEKKNNFENNLGNTEDNNTKKLGFFKGRTNTDNTTATAPPFNDEVSNEASNDNTSELVQDEQPLETEPIEDDSLSDSPSLDNDIIEDIDLDESLQNTTDNTTFEYDIPVVNTESFGTSNPSTPKEVEYMSDISNMFDNIDENSNINNLNIPNENYYSKEEYNKNPEFDPNVIFNGDPFNPLFQNYTTDLSSPNNDIGIQPEYSSPNKINNLQVKQNSISSVILSWDKYPDTVEYHLLHFNTKTKLYDDVCKLKTNKALLTGIIPSHIQQYKVIAYGSDKGHKILIASSSAISVSTSLPPVTGLEVISATTNSLTFSWEVVPDATNYIVYAYNPLKKSFVPVDETTENFITFSNIEGITNLKIKVAGISIINGVECMTGLSDEIIGYTSIATVNNIEIASVSSNSIKLTWPNITSVDVYKIYAFNDKTNRFEYVDTTPINQIVFNHLMPNKEYKFKIRAASFVDEKEVIGAPSEIIVVHTTT